MRIGFTGAGGTGKTTTAKIVAERLGIPFLPSVSRGVFAQFGLTESSQNDMTPAQLLELQSAIFEAFREQESQYEQYVADRTLLDHLVYCLYRCNRAITHEKLSDMRFSVHDHMARLDVVVYTPLGCVRPEQDGFREFNEAYNYLIDAAIRGLALFYDHVFTLTAGTPQQRAERVVSRCKLLGL